ncbi:MAG: methyltransferase [Candidatus Pacearchaeota archaeon]
MIPIKPKAYDVLGKIALVRFPDDFNSKEKMKFANDLLKKHKSIETVLEKEGKVKGRLRKIKTNYLAGVKTKEVLYKENDCLFRFNVDGTYFSPRLSNERKEISQKVKKNSEVLVMFSGVNPFGIVIAKNSKANKIYSVELNREANKYAKLNSELNKVKDRVELIQGDVKKFASNIGKKFDVIVMARPQLKDSFLKDAFKVSKKGTRIYYYDFCKNDEIDLILDKIKLEAKKSKKKIKIIRKKIAGEIAPYKFRMRFDMVVLN